MADFTGTRYAAVAGRFYPEDAPALKKSLDQYIQISHASPAGRVRALIVPHAGYQYSGSIAGRAYALVRRRKDVARVVVLAPAHRVAFRGVSVGNYHSFKTPLGEIPVDTAACSNLVAASSLFSGRHDAHSNEHALEVQLPFLQNVLGEFSLIPVVCGQLQRREIADIAEALADYAWRPDTLWIASSDFTHYGASFEYVPFTRDVPERLKELDMGAVRCIESLDAAAFEQYVEGTGATICGATPISILLEAMRLASSEIHCNLIQYTTSGKLTDDYDNSVSYASIAFTDSGKSEVATGNDEQDDNAEFTDQARQTLLALARQSIEANLHDRQAEPPAPDTLPPVVQREGAAFVTLELDGNLRGCIGNLEAVEPLYLNVIHNARNAAFQDPRFLPLTAAELPNVHIEISVLTPPRRIKSLEDFRLGHHGIILEKNHRRAVFLPQVAPEQGWDRETTLSHLALKAGLGPDDWRRGAEFQVFEAIVFSDGGRTS